MLFAEIALFRLFPCLPSLQPLARPELRGSLFAGDRERVGGVGSGRGTIVDDHFDAVSGSQRHRGEQPKRVPRGKRQSIAANDGCQKGKLRPATDIRARRPGYSSRRLSAWEFNPRVWGPQGVGMGFHAFGVNSGPGARGVRPTFVMGSVPAPTPQFAPRYCSL